MNKKVGLSFLLFMGSFANATGVTPSLRAPSLPTIDVMTNGSFEARKAGWTATSGGTFTINSATPLNGGANGVFTATASAQKLTSAQYTIPAGLQGTPCVASLTYKTSETTNFYYAQVIDGISNVLVGPTLMPFSPTASHLSLPFLCPTSGTMAVQFLSSGSASALHLDDITLGVNQLTQVSQAQLVGTLTYAATSGCFWQSSNTSSAFFTANGSCPTPTVTGNLSAPATQVPGFTLNNAPPGNYYIVAHGSFYKGGSNVTESFLGMSDSNTLWGQTTILNGNIAGGAALGAGQVIGNVSYTTGVSPTIQLTGYVVNSGDQIEVDAQVIPLTFLVYRFPSQSELAVNPSTINWTSDFAQLPGTAGVFPASGSLIPAADSSLTGSISPADSGVTVGMPCGSAASTGTTCLSGTPENGVVVNVPAAGKVLACSDFTVIAAGSGTISDQFQIEVTADGSDTPILSNSNAYSLVSSNNQSVTSPQSLCEVFNLPAAGKYAFKTFYIANYSGVQTTNQIVINHWVVRPITQNVPAPVLVGGVTTPSSGSQNIVAAEFDNGANSACASSPCIVNYQTGSSITSVTRVSTGLYTVNFAPGTFSAPPLCQCNATSGGGVSGLRFCFSANAGFGGSTTAVGFETSDNANAAVDSMLNITCIGSK